MIKVTANINGEKREVTNYSYQCNLRFCDFPNFAQLIMIYQSVKCKEPPVEGDLITLTFNSTGKDSFFYEWIISGDMYDGEIEFVCNEVDVVDIFRFWDCYCVGIEEYMSIGGAPMSLTVYLSPGIIKRNNLPVREKVWKVSSPSTDKKVTETDDSQENINKSSQKAMPQSHEINLIESAKQYEDIPENKAFPLEDSEININQLLRKDIGLVEISEKDKVTAIDACKRALDIKRQLPMTKTWINKTVASDSIVAVSGWTDWDNFTKISPKEVLNYCLSIGYIPFSSGGLDHIRNNGFSGKFNCSHAEKKILSQKPNEIIGVSKEMCPDCIKFCTEQAKKTQKTVIVADPKIIHIFTPDGKETRLANNLNEE